VCEREREREGEGFRLESQPNCNGSVNVAVEVVSRNGDVVERIFFPPKKTQKKENKIMLSTLHALDWRERKRERKRRKGESVSVCVIEFLKGKIKV